MPATGASGHVKFAQDFTQQRRPAMAQLQRQQQTAAAHLAQAELIRQLGQAVSQLRADAT